MKKKLFIQKLFHPLLSIFFLSLFFFFFSTDAHAQITLNGNCNLIVPANPLTAQGLATPYQLLGANAAADGPCHEIERFQTVIVQAAIIDPATGEISIYNPLVEDYGVQPIVAPVVPTLPPGAIVGIWGGTNTNNVTILDSQGSLKAGNCVNGVAGSIFGQNWHCNAIAFFTAAHAAITAGKLQVPKPGTGLDGMPCPTTEDFSIGDMDPHDNVTNQYLALWNTNQTAQFNTANEAILSTAQIVFSASDERLTVSVDQALGCNPWKAPDLSNPGLTSSALPLNELQAQTYPPTPRALVQANDPFTLDAKGNQNLAKLNAYRAMVGEPAAKTLTEPGANGTTYCQNMLNIQPGRMLLDKPYTVTRTSPDPFVANNLYTFMAQRFVQTYEDGGLNCMKLLNKPDPVTLSMDKNGVVVDASINAAANVKTQNCDENNGGLNLKAFNPFASNKPCSQ
jgi:hypothetical protein